MKVTPQEFESFMTRLDNDKTVDKKELKLILKNMETCKDWIEFNEFLESIAVDKEGKPVRKKNPKKKTRKKTQNAV